MTHPSQACDIAIKLLIQAKTGIRLRRIMLSLNNQSQNATLYDPIHTTFLKSQQLESPTPSEKRFTVDRG